MRIEGWRPEIADELINEAMPARLLEAAELLASYVRVQLLTKIGSGKTTGISRPVYRKGPWAGQYWTARHFGELFKSVRVTRKYGKTGRILWAAKNIRVYVGNNMAYYANIVEYRTPFMRPAFAEALERMKYILGAK